MSYDQVCACYFDHYNIFLIKIFALDLGTKFLKKMNKKTANKTFIKNLLLLFSLVLCWFSNLFFCIWTIWKNKRQICKDLLCSERTLVCCLSVYLFSTTDYIKKQKKNAKNKKQQRQRKFLKKELDWISHENIVNGKNSNRNKKENKFCC